MPAAAAAVAHHSTLGPTIAPSGASHRSRGTSCPANLPCSSRSTCHASSTSSRSTSCHPLQHHISSSSSGRRRCRFHAAVTSSRTPDPPTLGVVTSSNRRYPMCHSSAACITSASQGHNSPCATPHSKQRQQHPQRQQQQRRQRLTCRASGPCSSHRASCTHPLRCPSTSSNSKPCPGLWPKPCPHGWQPAAALPFGLSLPEAGLLQHVDVAVGAAAGASFKLLLLCALIAWMTQRKMLPPTTSKVLSQVGFSLTIPATLLTSTTRTLANPSSSLLVAVPLMAVAHIAVASLLGQLAAAAVAGRLPLTRALLGWRELHPTESAAAIAASTAAALRAPQAAAALIPTNQQPPAGLQQLVELACAFGNSLTLPLLYCSTLLVGDASLRATAYISLFHAAWSPLLWVWGYGRLLSAASSSSSGHASGRFGAGRAGRPAVPLSGFFSRLRALLRPASRRDSTSSTTTSSTSSSRLGQTSEVLVARQLSPAAAAAAGGSSATGRPVFAVSPAGEEAAADDQGSPAELLFKRLLRLSRGLVQLVLGPGGVAQLNKALSPPVIAVVAGVLLGCSPLGMLLSDPAAAAQSLPVWEAPLLLGLLRSTWETLELLASATLAVSALVLATSLFGPKDGAASGGSSSGSSTGASAYTVVGGGGRGAAASVEVVGADGRVITPQSEEEGLATGSSSEEDSDVTPAQGVTTHVRGAATADDASASVLDQLRPQGAWEWRLLVVVSLVRFVCMPLVTGVLVYAATQLQLLPDDPICWFVLLLEGAMPPAQNLVLMMQLRSKTAGLGPAAARLLLQLYALAVVPVTLWVSAIYPVVLLRL